MLLSRLARDQRGSVLTIFAVGIPTLILFMAIGLDVGNWYTHKLKLQNRGDAATFAAGLEYGYRFPDCTQIAAQENAIRDAAKQYGGVLNPGVNTRSNVAVNAIAARGGRRQ